MKEVLINTQRKTFEKSEGKRKSDKKCVCV